MPLTLWLPASRSQRQGSALSAQPPRCWDLRTVSGGMQPMWALEKVRSRYCSMPVSPSRKIGYVGIRAPTEAEAAEGRAETTSAHLTVGFEKNPRAQHCW